MKIRHGFVSNSSSSSFVVLTKSCQCDKCGMNPVEQLLMILKNNHYETELRSTQTIDEFLETKSEEIRLKEQEIAEHEKYPADEVIRNYWSDTITHGSVIEWAKKDIDNLKADEKTVLNQPKEFDKVCSFDIGYHDEGTLTLYNILKDKGYIIEIEVCEA